MYEPDGTENLFVVQDSDGIQHRLTLDLEDYARFMNDPGMQVLEEIGAIERPEPPLQPLPEVIYSVVEESESAEQPVEEWSDEL